MLHKDPERLRNVDSDGGLSGRTWRCVVCLLMGLSVGGEQAAFPRCVTVTASPTTTALLALVCEGIPELQITLNYRSPSIAGLVLDTHIREFSLFLYTLQHRNDFLLRLSVCWQHGDTKMCKVRGLGTIA